MPPDLTRMSSKRMNLLGTFGFSDLSDNLGRLGKLVQRSTAGWYASLLAGALLLGLTGCQEHTPAPAVQLGATGLPACPLGPATVTDGHRRLALLIGVGAYKNRKLTQLKGPPNDVRNVYALLTGENGYGFPKENVCALVDGEASTANFREAFKRALVERAEAGDVAVVYFSGHGSQARDKNGDEPSGRDQTLLFHDARTDGIRDLLDDELHKMLATLRRKTEHIVVILDSCNSGTATRADNATTFVARFQPPADDASMPAPTGRQEGGGAAPEDIPGLIALTAATDGTSALERAGRGVFTDALLEVLSAVGDSPLTYAQVARQVPPLVAARSYQIPYFHGNLSGPVFGNVARKQPIAWEVSDRGPPIQLAGPPLPGMGLGAELRVYDGRASGPDTDDPTKAKATVVVTKMTGLNAEAGVSVQGPSTAPMAAGDLAVLIRPADAFLRIKVRLRPAEEPGGLPQDRAQALSEAIAQDPEAALLVETTDGPGDYELSLDGDGRLVLRGPENDVRNVYQDDEEVPKSLWQHARQGALLQLRGEGGGDFKDNQTLQVQLVPAARQGDCARGTWKQGPPNSEQVMPLCYSWNVRVELPEDAPKPLLVGGVVLSNDGGLYGFPFDGRKVLLRPGERVTFDAQRETFTASPPLDVQDHLLVFGTQQTNPVPWHLLTDTAATRAAGPPLSGLYLALHRYLQPGSRGQQRAPEAADVTTWTLSHLTMRVRANQAP